MSLTAIRPRNNSPEELARYQRDLEDIRKNPGNWDRHDQPAAKTEVQIPVPPVISYEDFEIQEILNDIEFDPELPGIVTQRRIPQKFLKRLPEHLEYVWDKKEKFWVLTEKE